MSKPSSPRPEIGRVFIGVWEIANLIQTMGEALRARGYDVRTLYIDTPFNPYYQGNSYDDRIKWPAGDRIYRAWRDRGRFDLRMAWRLLQAIPRFKTFVFVWRYSFLPFQLDIPLLRLLGKRVVVFYCGDDVRYKPAQIEADRTLADCVWWPAPDTPEFERWIGWGRKFHEGLWSVKLAEKSGAAIVGSRDTATFQGRTWSGFMMPQQMLVSAPRGPSAEPLIVHAPTDRQLKGTTQVLEAVEAMRNAGVRFRFEVIEKMPFDELMSRLREADIVIDQPGAWPGRLGLAAMAAGSAVVGGNRPDYWHLPPDSPVQVFERDSGSLAAQLRGLIEDRSRLADVMRRSWEYANRMYSYEAFADFFEGVALGETPWPLPVRAGMKEIVLRSAPSRPERLLGRLFW